MIGPYFGVIEVLKLSIVTKVMSTSLQNQPQCTKLQISHRIGPMLHPIHVFHSAILKKVNVQENLKSRSM